METKFIEVNTGRENLLYLDVKETRQYPGKGKMVVLYGEPVIESGPNGEFHVVGLNLDLESVAVKQQNYRRYLFMVDDIDTSGKNPAIIVNFQGQKLELPDYVLVVEAEVCLFGYMGTQLQEKMTVSVTEIPEMMTFIREKNPEVPINIHTMTSGILEQYKSLLGLPVPPMDTKTICIDDTAILDHRGNYLPGFYPSIETLIDEGYDIIFFSDMVNENYNIFKQAIVQWKGKTTLNRNSQRRTEWLGKTSGPISADLYITARVPGGFPGWAKTFFLITGKTMVL